MSDTAQKYYEKGNFELESQAFAGTPANPSYSGDIKKWYGLMEISLSASQDTTNIAADDIADYLSMTPPMVLTGTIKVTGMQITEYEHLFNVTTDANGMYLFGSQKLPKEVGLAFKNTASINNELVTNKFMLFRCKVQLPNIGTTSIDEDGNTIRDFTMNVTASYIKYTNAGKTDFTTYGVVDSSNEHWDQMKNGLFVPNAQLTTI